jgi:hypothetical protein
LFPAVSGFKKQRKVFEKKATISEKNQEASYLVAELTAQKIKSHTIAASLMMLACKIIVRTMIGNEAESEIDEVFLSDNTVSRRVGDMSHGAENILSEILKYTNFALQVDESTDITYRVQMLAFVRFGNDGGIM